jgi:hypothetical protein
MPAIDGALLDLLVENMGRVNFGAHLLDRKGILGGVTFAELHGTTNLAVELCDAPNLG